MPTKFCALQDWSLCFPQSCESIIIKSHWPSKSDSLGIPSPFVRSPGWEAWDGVQNLYKSGRTSLVLLFSSLWFTHQAGMGFDFIMIVSLLGKTDVETPVFWSSDANSWSLEKSSCWERLSAEGKKGHQRIKWMDTITNAMGINLGRLQEMVRDREACSPVVHKVAKSQTWLGDWTTTTMQIYSWSSIVTFYLQS